MWYAFFGADLDDDVAFDKRVDAVCREIGDRGKPLLVLHEPQPAPAPAPMARPMAARTPAPAPASMGRPAAVRAPAPAPAPAQAPARGRSAALAPAQTTQAMPTPSLADSVASYGQVALPSSPSAQLSETFYLQLERDRAGRAERERADRAAERDRERAERVAERERERGDRERERERERAIASERELRLAALVACAATAAVASVTAAMVLRSR